MLWVASEKIHGSNFSVHVFGNFAKYGRRSDFITKEIPLPLENVNKIDEYFIESFYDARNIVKGFHNNLSDVWKALSEDFPEMNRFSLFGEYFGGNWPAEHKLAIKDGPKHIQQGIYYTPKHEFMAFDIYVCLKDQSFWVDVTDLPKYLGGHVKSVPVHAKGTFKDVFAIDTKIDSTIPEILGLERLEKNLIEGMVIRPNKSLKDAHQ